MKRHQTKLTYVCVGGCLLLGFGGAAPVVHAANASSGSGDACAYRPTFMENFDTLSVSPWGKNGSRWIAHTPWHGDFGDAQFVDPKPGFPFRTQDGVLEIEARKGADGNWQSGLLASATPATSGFAQRYGYFESRIRMPPGPGVWPAFWLNANQREDATNPKVEIDVVEYYGKFTDSFHSVVHVWDKDPAKSRAEDHITKVPAGALSSGFHAYGVDVEPKWLTFYFDRRKTWQVATPQELHDPSMVLLDLALGSGWPIDQTRNPSVMKVDYVHVYQRLGDGDQTGCPPPPSGTVSFPEAKQ